MSPVGVWSSVPRKTDSSTVCLYLDVALNGGTYEVAMVQWPAAAAASTSFSKTVLLQSTNSAQDNEQSTEWASVRVEAALDNSLESNLVEFSEWYYQFVISVSIVNASSSDAQNDMIVAFNNIYASDDSCSSKVGQCQLEIFSVWYFPVISLVSYSFVTSEKMFRAVHRRSVVLLRFL